MEGISLVQNIIYCIQVLLACYIFYEIVIIKSAHDGRLKDKLEYTHTALGYHKIALLIYGYDKTEHIKTLLPLLESQTYSRDLYHIHLIQDQNFWGDDTELEQMVQKINVLEPTQPCLNKSECLQWALNTLAEQNVCDAIVILDSSNIVKPDFVERVNLALMKGDIAQGYVASRNPYTNIISTMEHCLFRMKNRIYNAGKYYLGFSCTPLQAGLIIKTSLLKKHPYKHLSFYEYTFELVLKGINIVWAPHAVIYRKMSFTLKEFTTKEALILAQYNKAVEFLYTRILTGLSQYGFTNALNALFLVKPVYLLFYTLNLTFLFITLYFQLYTPFTTTCLLILAHIATFVLKTFAAKFSRKDYKVLPFVLLFLPLVYPMVFFKFLSVKKTLKRSQKQRIKPLPDKASKESLTGTIKEVQQQQKSSSPIQVKQPSQQRSILNDIFVNATFGIATKEVPCTFEIHNIHTQPHVKLIYHNKSMETKPENNLDEVFTHLEKRLGTKGLNLNICHNCGNFQYLSQIGDITCYTKGYCLLNKIGVPLTEEDTVYLWEGYCGEQVDKSQTEDIYNQWNRGY